MKFNNISIHNFGSIRDIDLSLNNRGLILLLGSNRDSDKADSNGSGKSLLLDAIVWVLWGKTVRGLSHDDVINRFIGQDCKVTLCIEEDNNYYEISRCRGNKSDSNLKINDLVLYCNDQDVSGISIQDTQSKINSLLGMDFTTFRAMMPGAGIKLAELSDREVKELLEKILQVESLNKAQELAKDKVKLYNYNIELLESKINNKLNNIKLYKERESVFQDNYDNFKFNMNKELGDINIQLEQNNVKQEYLINKIKDNESLISKQNDLDYDIKESKNKINELKLVLEKINKNKSNDLFLLEREKVRLEHDLTSLSSSINNMTDLNKDSICPTCFQSLDNKHVSSVVDSKKDKYNNIAKRIDDINFSIKNKNKEYSLRINELNNKISKAESYVSFLEAENNKLKSAKQLISTLNRELSIYKEAEVSLQNRYEEINLKENPFLNLLKDNKKSLDAEMEEKDNLLKELDYLYKELYLYKFWVDGFSPSGLRSYMLDHIIPVINKLAQKYSSILTSGELSIEFRTKETLKNGSTKEKFNIVTKNKYGGSTYLSNSTGERAKINLIIAIVLGELAAMRSEKVLPFRFMDEPFESIDNTGIGAIVGLLQEQSNRYNTVFVVTHKDHLKDLFDKKITIVKEEGLSRLEL